MKMSADGTGRSGSADGSKKASFTYNAERVLGSGSFGIVYQARRQVLEPHFVPIPIAGGLWKNPGGLY